MITAPTSCFWMIRVEGEAVGLVADTLSKSTTADIKEAVLISADFENDVQGHLMMDNTVKFMKQELEPLDMTEVFDYNPLYIPSTQEEIDSVLDADIKGESISFTGMDGSPFTAKILEVTNGDREIIQAKLSYRPFDMPSYSEIIRGQKKELLN